MTRAPVSSDRLFVAALVAVHLAAFAGWLLMNWGAR